jgi:hypothetical protein
MEKLSVSIPIGRKFTPRSSPRAGRVPNFSPTDTEPVSERWTITRANGRRSIESERYKERYPYESPASFPRSGRLATANGKAIAPRPPFPTRHPKTKTAEKTRPHQIKPNPMDSTTNQHLFAPANDMTKLEAVTVEIFARQYDLHSNHAKGFLERLTEECIEAAQYLLHRLEGYQQENSPALRGLKETRNKIARLIEEKRLDEARIKEILFFNHNASRIDNLAPSQLEELAAYLETI